MLTFFFRNSDAAEFINDVLKVTLKTNRCFNRNWDNLSGMLCSSVERRIFMIDSDFAQNNPHFSYKDKNNYIYIVI